MTKHVVIDELSLRHKSNLVTDERDEKKGCVLLRDDDGNGVGSDARIFLLFAPEDVGRTGGGARHVEGNAYRHHEA